MVRALSDEVPIALIERGAPVEDAVTLQLEAATWESLIGRLLSRRSYALLWNESSEGPSSLVVFWDAVRQDRSAGNEAEDDEGLEARIRAVAEGYAEASDPAGKAIALLEEKREAYQEAQRAFRATANPDSTEGQKLARQLGAARAAYQEALGGLADYDEARSVDAVLPSTAEADAKIRRSALQTLRWLSHSGGNPEVIEAAKDSLRAPEDDAEERAALEVLVRYGKDRQVLALLEPLALEAGPNQNFAARNWLRIRDEQAARAEEVAAKAEESEEPGEAPAKSDGD